ncbi:alpha/beta hydrolase [Actinoallomurus sp. NPDC050550]|uniref:alpha/beta fold hydrolase n=1 Tax=Actinoallomurus sp. NPDC050550 TaxID=3154937 RepID=UPI0033F5D7C7
MESILKVSGAEIFYRTRGSGPVLLLLPGGDGDADACDGLAVHLEDAFTVVTFDRRGLSRSTSTGAAPDLTIHADDAARVLATVTHQPALVFGASIGALIALELTTRHPDQVRVAVAHEPPVGTLLPADTRAELAGDQLAVEEAHRRDGALAAMAQFIRLARLDFSDREPDVHFTPPGPERLPNLEFFLTHDAPAVRRYHPDITALRAHATKIVPAVGATTTGPIAQCAHALADLLNTPVTTLPGGHNGFASHPRALAAHLRTIFAAHR